MTLFEFHALETTAVFFGIVSVWFSAREKIWGWPTSIINVSLYFVFFGQQRLYAVMGLQVFYGVISAYGWYHWLFGGQDRTVLRISRTPRRYAFLLPAIWGIGLLTVGTILDRTTDAAIPYLDSALAVASLIAMWMMSRKYLENWAVWIAVNIGSIIIYLRQGIPQTAFQYAVFLVLATMGLVTWSRRAASRESRVASHAS